MSQTVLPCRMPRAKSTSPAPQAPSSDDAKIFEELNMLFHRMMGEIFLSPEETPPPVAKLTHSQGRILLYIALRGPQRMSDLARLLSISLPSVTPVIDGLVAAKLVRRRQDPNDRRVVRVELTAAGRRFHEQMDRHHAGKLKQAFSHTSPEEQQEVLEYLRRIVSLLRRGDVPSDAQETDNSR